jgi:uncharacterized protein YciI
MSSSASTKRLFAIYAPDYTDPEALDRRFSVREEHMKGIERLKSTGTASTCILPQPSTTANHDFLCAEFGGPLLAPELTDEKGRNKMTGSILFFEAESIEEVRKIVESDVYYTSGVVRLTFPSSTIQSISFFDSDLVEQGAYLYLTFYTGDALAVELKIRPRPGWIS